MIQAAVGRISFTADLWSDPNLRSYLAMTAHWIARDRRSNALELKAALIAFHHVHGKHDGKNLAKVTMELLDRACITTKVSSMM